MRSSRRAGDDAAAASPPGPVLTHGHSKDHRPDLKQFMTELLCVERGVPIFGRTLWLARVIRRIARGAAIWYYTEHLMVYL